MNFPSLTKQQRAAIQTKIDDWTRDELGPVRFVYDNGGTFEPEQVSISRAVAGFERGGTKVGTAIKSGKGIGKTYSLAWLALWKLICFEMSSVILTAPKEDQIWDHLWAEADQVIRSASFLSKVLDFTATRIAPKGGPELWQMVGRVANKKENIQGFHADHMLFVVDEATGVEDVIIDTIIEGLTQPDNQIVMAANPWHTRGAFYDAFHRNKSMWNNFTFDASKSRRVSSASIQRNLRRGPQDPVAQVVVFGNFPPRMADAIFNVSDFYDARNRTPLVFEGDKIEVGLDVARYGSDSCALAARRGRHLFHLDRWGMASTVETAEKLIAFLQAQRPGEVAAVKIDVIGIGAGVVDQVLDAQHAGRIHSEIEVIGVNVARKAHNRKRFATVRDEQWITFSEDVGDFSIDSSIDSFLVDTMASDAAPARKIFMNKGILRVNTKEEMKKETPEGNSPDMMDAILLAYYNPGFGVIGEVDSEGQFYEV